MTNDTRKWYLVFDSRTYNADDFWFVNMNVRTRMETFNTQEDVENRITNLIEKGFNKDSFILLYGEMYTPSTNTVLLKRVEK